MDDRRLDGNVEHAFRTAYGPAVATLVRVFGDISAAEDAVQDAFVVAAERWPNTGIPPNPSGWIVTTARRRAIDHHRRERRGRELLALVPSPEEEPLPSGQDSAVPDDQLRLIFTCCHPSLRTEHQVALTLRLLGGLSVEEVARSFLVSESAMARRLGRAKYKITAARIPYRVPDERELPARIDAVLAVVYLIYNAGADRPEGQHLRTEAVRLARSLVALLPAETEVHGLLALVLLSESRASARYAADGSIVVLADQDRAAWDRALVAEGQAIVRACVAAGRPGPYQIQAAIQAVHGSAAAHGDTDWPQIVALYDHLYALLPTPIVAMNRAIALSEVDGPAAGLAELDRLSPELDGYHLFHASRATMLRRLGQTSEAELAFGRAADLAPDGPSRDFLRRQQDDLVGRD